MSRLAVALNALMLWAFAVIGAVGVAVWLKLATQDAVILAGAVAVVAFFGDFCQRCGLELT